MAAATAATVVKGESHVVVLGCKFSTTRTREGTDVLQPTRAECPPPWHARMVEDARRRDARAAIELASTSGAGVGFRGERDTPGGHFIVLVRDAAAETAGSGPVLKAYPITDWYAFAPSRAVNLATVDKQVETAERLLAYGERPTAVTRMREKVSDVAEVSADSSSRSFALSGIGGGMTGVAAAAAVAAARVSVEDDEGAKAGRRRRAAATSGGNGGSGPGGVTVEFDGDDLEGVYAALLNEKRSAVGLGYENTDSRRFDMVGMEGGGDAAAADFDMLFEDDVGDAGEMEPAEEDFAGRHGVDTDEAAVGEAAIAGQLAEEEEDGAAGADDDDEDEDEEAAAAAAAADGKKRRTRKGKKGGEDDADGSAETAAQAAARRDPTLRMFRRLAKAMAPPTAIAATAAAPAAAEAPAVAGVKRSAAEAFGDDEAGAAGESDARPDADAGVDAASAATGDEGNAGGDAGDDEESGEPSAAKRARMDHEYADEATLLRERLRRLAISLGGRMTMAAVSREFGNELKSEAGAGFKVMLVNVLKSMTRRMLARDGVTQEYVLKE